MAVTKNKYFWLFIGLFILIIILVLLFIFWEKLFPKDEKEKKQEEDAAYQADVKDAENNNEPPPPPPTLENGSFPLSTGDKNIQVQKMQEALISMGAPISAGATGYFGSQTKSALDWAGYDNSSVDEVDYNSILAGKKKVSLKIGSNPVATKSGGKIYDSLNFNKEVGTTFKGSSHGMLVKIIGNYLGLTSQGGVNPQPEFWVSKEYFT